ncbi:RNase adapter RapZ [Amphibiibacter pelophylacis]|uniref:RNase adapter RapZ n=1 Tax=Amphibiibacter pelophylacis TaxID=1799477 RepID=A0ACC6P3Z3_9BURK
MNPEDSALIDALLDPGSGEALSPPHLVLLAGTAGSGKSVALRALEDAGFYCCDNLPPELVGDFLRLMARQGKRRVAVAIDVYSGPNAIHLEPVLERLREREVLVQRIFLDASEDVLLRRYSESRRPHPLTGGDAHASAESGRRALVDAMALEREMLQGLREASVVVDTSHLRPSQLRSWILQTVQAASNRLTLVFESFGFKHGLPMDADLVFDARVLPNPFYEAALRPLTGLDAPVADFLRAQPPVAQMLQNICGFIENWLPVYQQDLRSYLTVAIGCTGGQHRSVYLVEALGQYFAAQAPVLLRHRELRRETDAAAAPSAAA